MELTIKPHHFMDIIKLHGSGIEVFVPDVTMNHDFYKVANRIMEDHKIRLHLTVGADDICLPCNMCKGRDCTDSLTGIPGFDSKGLYNEMLDNRIIALYELDSQQIYEARTLCGILYRHHELIYTVWKEEDDAVTEKRHRLFVAGAEKFL